MIKQFEIKNQNLSCKILNYGATISDICFDNRHLVLRFDDLETYRKRELNQYFGSSVGRVANRIANAKFHLNNQEYNLDKNNGTCSLHGGTNGYGNLIWDLVEHKDDELILQLKSKHLDENYPGSLIVEAKFKIPNDVDDIQIQYTARLDDSNPSNLQTIVNLTNHTYFNLDGCESAEKVVSNDDQPTILDHFVLSKDAKAYLEQDSSQVSTGRIIRLEEADPSFQINNDFIKLREGCSKGLYDHAFVFDLNSENYTVLSNPDVYRFHTIGPKSKIKLTMKTNNVSVHFYCGPRKNILNYPPLSAFCVEAQAFPNACNVPDWLNQCLVTKEKPYSKFITFSFSKNLN